MTVINGQQRIITFFLIIHALNSLRHTDLEKEMNIYLNNKDNGNLRDSRLFISNSFDKDEYSILEKRRYDEIEDWNFYKSKNTLTSNIIRNFSYIRDELKELVNEYGSKKILTNLEKFRIVAVEAEKNIDDPQQIYESNNSMGQPLEKSDLIKNFIMMGKNIDEQKFIYKEYWLKLEEIFSHSKDNVTITDFLRHYLASINNVYPKDESLYNEFQNYWNKKADAGSSFEEVLDQIIRYAEFYKLFYIDKEYKIINIDNKNKNEYKERKVIIDDLRFLKTRNSFPFLLYFYNLYKKHIFGDNKKITIEQFYEITKIINTYQIRKYFSGSSVDSKAFTHFLGQVKDMVEKQNNNYEDIVEIVNFVLVNKNEDTPGRKMPDDEQIINNLINKEIYKTDSWHVKWMLWKIEKEYFENKNLDESLEKWNIEHFAPINPKDDGWLKMFNMSENGYKKEINKIGNLALLNPSSNTSLSNKSLDEKVVIYKENSASYTETFKHIIKSIGNEQSWNEKKIKERSKDILGYFLSLYKYKKVEGNLDLDPNKEVFLYNDENMKIASGYVTKNQKIIIKKGSTLTSDSYLVKNFSKYGSYISKKVFIKDTEPLSFTVATALILGDVNRTESLDLWKNEKGDSARKLVSSTGKFSFYKFELKDGDILTFKDDETIKAKIISSNVVECYSKQWKLSTLALHILNEIKGRNRQSASGIENFRFKGKLLSKMPIKKADNNQNQRNISKSFNKKNKIVIDTGNHNQEASNKKDYILENEIIKDKIIKIHLKDALGYLTQKGKIIIQKGSIIDKEVLYKSQKKEKYKYINNELNQLINNETIVLQNDRYVFVKDSVKYDPSLAASLIYGTSQNGWTTWKDENDKKIDWYRKNKNNFLK
ncbi:DUF4357 domain-containing protein [Mycoplasmopsis agassizii]|uniref:DUF4357 domain-containing protein n=1 Tax=Mycoplasmopsis agassizii TaxID=33922 RepID=UPI0035273B5A